MGGARSGWAVIGRGGHYFNAGAAVGGTVGGHLPGGTAAEHRVAPPPRLPLPRCETLFRNANLLCFGTCHCRHPLHRQVHTHHHLPHHPPSPSPPPPPCTAFRRIPVAPSPSTTAPPSCPTPPSPSPTDIATSLCSPPWPPQISPATSLRSPPTSRSPPR